MTTFSIFFRNDFTLTFKTFKDKLIVIIVINKFTCEMTWLRRFALVPSFVFVFIKNTSTAQHEQLI